MNELPFLPYGRQTIDEEDIKAVTRALTSDFLTTGPEIAAFEKELCEYTGAQYAVAVANGTAALHLAVLALDLPRDSIGITSPNTFVATSNALLYAGHSPRFVDIDLETYVIDPNKLSEYFEKNCAQVVLPVHFAGNTVGVEEIYPIARANKAFVIEDAAHSIGGEYRNGKKVGSCIYSDMTTFSFHPVKTMTTGEGGAITTNDPKLYQRLMTLRTHGIVRDPDKLSQAPGPWYYEMQMLGFNYRITDIQAALGRSQLQKLDKFVDRRAEVVHNYNKAFRDIDWITIPKSDNERKNAWHLYVLQMDWEKIGYDRVTVMEKLRAKGVGSQVLYIPVPDQPYYNHHFRVEEHTYHNARKYYDHALAIPLYPSMGDEDQTRVSEAITSLV